MVCKGIVWCLCNLVLPVYITSVCHGSYSLDQVLNLISHLEKSLNSVKLFEKYLISLLGLETSLNFSTFLFLFLYFKWYFCTSERLQESYPMTVVILHSVVTINYGSHRKITNDCAECFSHAPASSSGASFFAWQRRARNK